MLNCVHPTADAFVFVPLEMLVLASSTRKREDSDFPLLVCRGDIIFMQRIPAHPHKVKLTSKRLSQYNIPVVTVTMSTATTSDYRP